MDNTYLFIGGPHNGQQLPVNNPGLTQTLGQHQYILHTINGQEIYAEIHLCHREVKAATKTIWKHNPQTQTTWPPPTTQPTDFPPPNAEETTQSVDTSDDNQEVQGT